jgi:hypothetical protein
MEEKKKLAGIEELTAEEKQIMEAETQQMEADIQYFNSLSDEQLQVEVHRQLSEIFAKMQANGAPMWNRPAEPN